MHKHKRNRHTHSVIRTIITDLVYEKKNFVFAGRNYKLSCYCYLRQNDAILTLT